jgi:hypothetical protein
MPPPGVVGVPGASGGLAPGGDELDGGAVVGVLGVLGEGGEPRDEAGPEGAAGDCAWAAVALANPRAATSMTECSLSISVTSFTRN